MDRQVRYILTVQRVTSGTWPEFEFTEVGKKADGTAEYGNRPVEKPRELKVETFKYETEHEPDIPAITEFLNRERAGVVSARTLATSIGSRAVATLRGLRMLARLHSVDIITMRATIETACEELGLEQ